MAKTEKPAQQEQSAEAFETIVNPYGKIGRVVGVMSGKGGVGKSSVTALLVASLTARGLRTGILDADITGPSIPRLFGIRERVGQISGAFIPVETALGTKVISINLMLEEEDSPVIWRGPLIAGVVKQFFVDTDWGDLDYLLVDLPPGTGDVPLTVMQSLPLDGMIMVTSPQELVGMIVRKAVRMTQMLKIPIIGIIENMSYVECPDCHRKIQVFGISGKDQIVGETGIELLGSLPLLAEVAALNDEGKVEFVEKLMPDFFEAVVDKFLAVIEKTEKKE